MASSRLSLTCVFVTSLGAACGGGGGFPDARVIDGPPPGGRFSLSWTLTDMNGAPVTCEQVGAATVSIAYHDPHVSGGGAEAFTCGTGSGTSQVLSIGTYDLSVSLVDRGGTTLVMAPAQTKVPITTGATTPLTAATFPVDATGNLKLHLSSHAVAGNCGAVAASGAGITSTTITLFNGSDGSCAPVTFAVGSGSNTAATTYTVECATPVAGPCIEGDQELDALGIPSGAYQIHVKGKNGSGTTCWTNNDSFAVPGAGHDLIDNLNLGATGGSGC